jgi:YD repeat-containing protein
MKTNLYIKFILSLFFIVQSTIAGQVLYLYDSLDRLTNVDYGNGSVITYTYDPAGNRLAYSAVVSGDTTPPNLTITSPTTGPAYTNNTTTISLAGTASDNVGVTLVTWANDRGGIGTATGTSSWNISGIQLQTGANTVSVTVWDAAGNSTAATLTVTLQAVVSPPNQLGGVTFSNGKFNFVLNGPVGSNFLIFASSDLVNWTALSTNTIPPGGLIALMDSDASNFPHRFYRAAPTNAMISPGPSLIASNLNGPQGLVLDGNHVYFADSSSTDGIIKSVGNSGGTVATLVTGLSTSESHMPSFVIVNSTIYGGYGGYNAYNMFSAPSSGGASTTIGSTTGGYFFGVANSIVYYGSGFYYINSITTSGANATQLASGVWVRGSAVDGIAIYFSDYDTKNVYKYSFASGTVTPLITGNSSSDGGLFIDANNVYFNNAGNVLEVSKGGGAVTTLVSSGAAGGYASDGSNVFYVETNAIKSVPVIGGTPSAVVNLGTGGVSSMVVDGSYIYWSDTSGGAGVGKIWRMAKP